MPKPSKLDRFFSHEEIIKLAQYLRENPSLTVDEFRDELADKGLDVHRSTAHEYQRKLTALGNRMRQSKMMAESLVSELGNAANEGQYGRALVEMARTLVFEFQSKVLDGSAGDLDTKDFAFLGKALKELAQAARLDQDFEMKVAEIRAEAERQVRAEAAKKLDAAAEEANNAGEAGLSADRVAQLRREFLGVKPTP